MEMATAGWEISTLALFLTISSSARLFRLRQKRGYFCPAEQMPRVSSIAQVNVLALIDEVKHDGNPSNATSNAHDNTTAAAPIPSPKPKAKRRSTARDNENLLKRALAYSRAGAPPGTSMVGVDEDEGREIRATAAALLRRLIVDKQECLRTHFRKIPFMPQARVFRRDGRVSCTTVDAADAAVRLCFCPTF